MTQTRKKQILIAMILFTFACLFGFLLYYLFTRTSIIRPLPIQPVSTTTIPGLPTAGERPEVIPGEEGQLPVLLPTAGEISKPGPAYIRPEAVERITTDYAIHTAITPNGSLRYHNANDGKFYKIDSEGIAEKLSNKVFYNVDNVAWANGKDVAVIEYPDGSNIIYDFENTKQVTVPKHWEEFSFAPEDDQIGAKSMGLSESNRWLISVKTDGTGTKLIEPMGKYADKVDVTWSPTGQTLAFSRTGDIVGADREEVLFVGLHGENFKSLVVEGFDFRHQWSPTGKQLLFSTYSDRSDYKPELWIASSFGDNIGSNRTLLNLDTWADKCTFAGQTALYCAVPQTMPRGAGMAPEIVNDVYDNLYKIDLKTRAKTPVTLDGKYTIDSINYDVTSNKVLFTDKNKTGVYKVNL